MTYSYRRKGLGLLAIAVVWNAIVGGSAYFAFTPEQPVVLKIIIGAFAVLGILLLVGAIRATIIGARSGEAILTLDRMPLHAGERTTGRLEWTRLPRMTGVKIVVTCTIPAGDGYRELWRDEQQLRSDALLRRADGGSVPFAIDIPLGQPNESRWTLSATLDGAPDYACDFRIPVAAR